MNPRGMLHIPNKVYTKYSKCEVALDLTECSMEVAYERPVMTDGRALLTDREREILAGDAGVSDNYRYKVESTARQRVRQLEEDVAILREHHPETFEVLQEIVCEPNEL